MDNSLEQIEQHFARITHLIGEKSRAIMLWNLLDGRAYTATELAVCADISPQAASNHLSKLIKAHLLTVKKQGRHKYYRFANDKVARVIENIAGLLPVPETSKKHNNQCPEGIHYARTCYDHLAGKLGVDITSAMLKKRIIQPQENQYVITIQGEHWFDSIGIQISSVTQMKRKFAYPCLDWTERKHHLGGALGAALYSTMVKKDWIRKNKQSREVVITPKGITELKTRLDLVL